MGKLWAITCYFNPVGYRRRLENYLTFRQRLRAPLITVELSYDQTFQLAPGSAEILIQLRGQDVLWQKERLLNVALAAVPPECNKIAWLDCDVVFERSDWELAAESLLDEFALIQPFTEVREPGCGASPDEAGPGATGYSLAHVLAAGSVPSDLLRTNMRVVHRCNSGLAWAARREVLPRGGFYDACVMGSGDRAMVNAALGRPEDAIDYLQMNPRWQEHYLAWAAGHFRAVEGRIGCLDGGLVHLWHGDLARRRYLERHREFREFAFDPGSDITVGSSGCWRWNSDKPEMHRYVKRYFESRGEDG